MPWVSKDLCFHVICLVLLTFCFGQVDSVDDAVLSVKSLVLGSLQSGEKMSGDVARSSCHNYFMNVPGKGFNLVVDLNTSSSQLFLLVKASPILRHSLEEEHNFANYYQVGVRGLTILCGYHSVLTQTFLNCPSVQEAG